MKKLNKLITFPDEATKAEASRKAQAEGKLLKPWLEDVIVKAVWGGGPPKR